MPLSDWPRSAAGYETICELGKSAHGSTWKASCTTNGRVVSIKRLNFDAQANLSFELFDAIRKEVTLSMTFSHKCIQTVHAAFMNDAELWVVVDYMDKVSVRLLSRVIAAAFRRYHCCVSAHAAQGSLADVIEQLRRSSQAVDERLVFHVASQLLSAM
jgi:serine/threonine protein kinase